MIDQRFRFVLCIDTRAHDKLDSETICQLISKILSNEQIYREKHLPVTSAQVIDTLELSNNTYYDN